MSKMDVWLSLGERIFDLEGNCIVLHDLNEEVSDEHLKLMNEAACEDWNDMHMEQYYDGVLKGKIQSVTMSIVPKKRKPGEKQELRIRFVCVPGFRLTAGRRTELEEQTEMQMCDGWGEGFYSKIFYDSNGLAFSPY